MAEVAEAPVAVVDSVPQSDETICKEKEKEEEKGCISKVYDSYVAMLINNSKLLRIVLVTICFLELLDFASDCLWLNSLLTEYNPYIQGQNSLPVVWKLTKDNFLRMVRVNVINPMDNWLTYRCDNDLYPPPGYNSEPLVCVSFEMFYNMNKVIADFDLLQGNSCVNCFLPHNQTCIFDSHTIRYEGNLQSAWDSYVPVNLTNYRNDNVDLKTVSECMSMESLYTGTVFIFSLECMLLLGLIVSSAMTIYSKSSNEKEKQLAKFAIPAFNIYYLLSIEGSQLGDLFKLNNEIEKARNTNVISRIIGLYNPDFPMNSMVPIGSMTFFPCCFMNPERQLKYGDKKIKLWQAIMYPFVLFFTNPFRGYSAWLCPFIFAYYGAALFTILGVYLLLIVFLFFPYMALYGDHAFTIRIVEDLPQLIMGLYYNYKVQYNGFALFSSAVSAILLAKALFEMIRNILADKRIENKSKPPPLGQLFDDLWFYERIYLTIVTPCCILVYFALLSIFYLVKLVSLSFLCCPEFHFCLVKKYFFASNSDSDAESDTNNVSVAKGKKEVISLNP